MHTNEQLFEAISKEIKTSPGIMGKIANDIISERHEIYSLPAFAVSDVLDAEKNETYIEIIREMKRRKNAGAEKSSPNPSRVDVSVPMEADIVKIVRREIAKVSLALVMSLNPKKERTNSHD